MKRENILNTVTAVFSSLTGVKKIQESDDLVDDLGISSMDMLLLMSSLEEEFNIVITERMIRRVATIADLVDVLETVVN